MLVGRQSSHLLDLTPQAVPLGAFFLSQASGHQGCTACRDARMIILCRIGTAASFFGEEHQDSAIMILQQGHAGSKHYRLNTSPDPGASENAVATTHGQYEKVCLFFYPMDHGLPGEV